MDATATPLPKDNTRFRSRPGALIWFFRKSRDRWKEKCQKMRANLQRERNQVAAVTKSREQWKLKAREVAAEHAAMQQEKDVLQHENEVLRAQVRQLEERKKKH